jgi:hypothetical protein
LRSVIETKWRTVPTRCAIASTSGEGEIEKQHAVFRVVRDPQ